MSRSCARRRLPSGLYSNVDITPLQNHPAREWVRAVEHEGFRRRKSGGSHHIYQHPDGRRVLLVYHNVGETFGPKTIRQILRSTGWTEDDLRRLGLISQPC
jgi:predicted RNA binding protein YcfA (HicA-like mRNA interferase family)